MNRIVTIASIALLLAGCKNSPYEMGVKMAERYDACVADYTKASDQVGVDFSKTVAGSYDSRAKAIEDYMQLLQKCHQAYLNKWMEIEVDEAKARTGMKNVSDVSEFETGLLTDREYNRFVDVPSKETATVPAVVMQAVRTINPPKPDEAQIALDLVGHTLAEGKENGYYPRSWTYKIADGSISNLQIVSTQENTDERYTIVVTMRLNSGTKAFDAKVNVSYVLDDISDWKIEFVRSLGMNIVKTHKYDGCVRCYYVEGWAGGLFAENNCDISLEVGGKELYNREWKTFSIIVPPHSQSKISWSSEGDFVIDYVERP